MISRRDLEIAVEELENSEPTYQNCAKLADLYTILDHLKVPLLQNNTSFLQAVSGKSIDKVMGIMDEMMEATQVLNPKLYENVMKRINEL